MPAKPTTQPAEAPAAIPARRSITGYREAATALRAAQSYDGVLSNALYLALEGLLFEPIDPRYIKTLPPIQGKPYESTGIRTAQVQVDRLNAVLGGPHWRKLLHYEDGGGTCHAHVIVGNNLGHATLDALGGLLQGDADLLVHRSGWGGHARAKDAGDRRKGAETNALKRTIAQVGPGHEVYCLDFDEDANPTARDYSQIDGPAAAAELPAGDPVVELASLVESEPDLAALRKETDDGMRIYGLSVDDRLARLKGHPSQEGLEGLRDRISLALDERSG